MRKGFVVEAIPGLPSEEWEILRRALSYGRSDRPSTVDGFVAWGDRVEKGAEPADRKTRRVISPQRMWPAVIAAVIILVSGFWLIERGTDGEAVPPAEPLLPEETVEAEPAISAGEALVGAATRALDEGHEGLGAADVELGNLTVTQKRSYSTLF